MRRLMSDDGGLKLPTKQVIKCFMRLCANKLVSQLMCCLQAAFLVNGIATEILLTHFGDRIFIAVTQLQKLGTIVRLVVCLYSYYGSLGVSRLGADCNSQIFYCYCCLSSNILVINFY